MGAGGTYGWVLAYNRRWGGNGTGPGWRRIPSAVVIQDILAALWGLTFTGYVLLLWPLSSANHSLISRLWRE